MKFAMSSFPLKRKVLQNFHMPETLIPGCLAAETGGDDVSIGLGWGVDWALGWAWEGDCDETTGLACGDDDDDDVDPPPKRARRFRRICRNIRIKIIFSYERCQQKHKMTE